MLLKFATEREKSCVADLAQILKACGQESISVAGDYLK
jgi:PTS system mannose-specific IIA component